MQICKPVKHNCIKITVTLTEDRECVVNPLPSYSHFHLWAMITGEEEVIRETTSAEVISRRTTSIHAGNGSLSG